MKIKNPRQHKIFMKLCYYHSLRSLLLNCTVLFVTEFALELLPVTYTAMISSDLSILNFNIVSKSNFDIVSRPNNLVKFKVYN